MVDISTDDNGRMLMMNGHLREIYDFGGGDSADAGGAGGLHETLDEFNDDTFGGQVGNVGKSSFNTSYRAC